jgi:hypothetical protein
VTDKLEMVELTKLHDLVYRGLTALIMGAKLIIRYPVDYNYFERIKLKMKLDGDDYVLGETTMGLDGMIDWIWHKKRTMMTRSTFNKLLDFKT